MPALRDLQMQFVAALLDPQQVSVHAHICDEGIDAGERIDIYRNNLREGFIKALALGFPVIERLGGDAYFRQLAVEFLRAQPSRRRCGRNGLASRPCCRRSTCAARRHT